MPLEGKENGHQISCLFVFKYCTVLQVLFRYALAVLSYMEEKLKKQNDYMSIFNTFRAEVKCSSNMYRCRFWTCKKNFKNFRPRG